MCLSSVYRDNVNPDNLIMDKVIAAKWKDGKVTLTDLLGRQKIIEGIIAGADLNNNNIIIANLPGTAA